jgi:hypothetical protein
MMEDSLGRETDMIRLVFAILLMSSPAWAQGKRVDNCAPIGRTADGKLVYSMKCDNLPVPVAPAPPPAAAVEPGPAPTVAAEPEPDQGGLFKFPFPGLIKPSTERPAGVGPAQPR